MRPDQARDAAIALEVRLKMHFALGAVDVLYGASRLRSRASQVVLLSTANMLLCGVAVAGASGYLLAILA